MSHRTFWRITVSLLCATLCAAVNAEEVTAAVAANFTSAIQPLALDFERATGHKLTAIYGATGKLYAQIRNGAPFDVLLSADEQTPKQLEQEGWAVPGTRYTYAVGRLVLWSPKPSLVDERGDILKNGEFAHLAIANPSTAPYGAAAEQVMRHLGVWGKLASRLVQGENVAQAMQFVHSGNAELGFVALAQVRALPPSQNGSQWLVPSTLHQPLRQDAVLLSRAAANNAARAFLAYLRSARAKAIMEELGYASPP